MKVMRWHTEEGAKIVLLVADEAVMITPSLEVVIVPCGERRYMVELPDADPRSFLEVAERNGASSRAMKLLEELR